MVLVAVSLTACGHRPDVMTPVRFTDKQTSKVDMLVATTRQPATDPALLFTGERGADISLNNVVVSIPPDGDREVGQVQWPETRPVDPQKSFVTVKADKIAERQVAGWFRKASGRKRRVLIFVHGFNTTYADAVFRFAQIAHDIHTDAAPVLFTCPRGATHSTMCTIGKA